MAASKSTLESQPNSPLAVFVQLTTSCNARCVNCPHPFTYGSEGSHPSGRMSDRVWRKIIADLQRMEYREQVGLYLHHEPFLDSALFERIRSVNVETSAFVVLSTNGSLLNERAIRRLLESKPRQIHININSAEKKQYEQMTGLKFEAVIENSRQLIASAKGVIEIQINCPVLPGVDAQKLVELFPSTRVNTEFWATSRGGLLADIAVNNEQHSRFKLGGHCVQPTINFNILYDGSIIACCMDWAHESKPDFPNILDCSIQEIFCGKQMRQLQEEFRNGIYSRYRMCVACSREMAFGSSNPQ